MKTCDWRGNRPVFYFPVLNMRFLVQWSHFCELWEVVAREGSNIKSMGAMCLFIWEKPLKSPAAPCFLCCQGDKEYRPVTSFLWWHFQQRSIEHPETSITHCIRKCFTVAGRITLLYFFYLRRQIITRGNVKVKFCVRFQFLLEWFILRWVWKIAHEETNSANDILEADKRSLCQLRLTTMNCVRSSQVTK